MVDKIKPAPIAITNNRTKGITIRKLYTEKFTPVISITNIIGISEINDVMNDEQTRDNGKKYFGTYTFLINWLLLIMEFMAKLVASEKKEYSILPVRTYTGKFSILLLKTSEKIIVSTTIISKGLSKLQSTPKYEFLYFKFISFFINSKNKSLYLIKL